MAEDATQSLKTRLRRIWLGANALGVAAFAALAPVLWGLGAELVPIVILSAVGGVVARLVALFVLVPLFARELDGFVDDAKVERVGEDVSVESRVTLPDDPDLAEFVQSYAFAKDPTIKTIVLLMAIGLLLLVVRLRWGPIF